MTWVVQGHQIEGATRIAGASEVTRQRRAWAWAWSLVRVLGGLEHPGRRAVTPKGVARAAASWLSATVLGGGSA